MEIVAFILLLVTGISTIALSKRIGNFVFDIYTEIREELAISPQNKRRWRFFTGWLGLWMGRSFPVWLIRIVGAGFICGALIFLLFVIIRL
jgi:hypothetical protein